jgi:hypothetical protein
VVPFTGLGATKEVLIAAAQGPSNQDRRILLSQPACCKPAGFVNTAVVCDGPNEHSESVAAQATDLGSPVVEVSVTLFL